MAQVKSATAAPRPSRRDTPLGFDPFDLDTHGTALLERRVMLAPVIVSWRY